MKNNDPIIQRYAKANAKIQRYCKRHGISYINKELFNPIIIN